MCLEQADSLIEKHGLIIDSWGRFKLAKAVGACLQRASLVLKDEAEGKFLHDIGMTPARTSARPTAKLRSHHFTFEELLEDWNIERQPRLKTLYEATNLIHKLKIFLGHNDVRLLTADEMISWKDYLRTTGISPRTIRSGKIATVRSMLAVAVQNRKTLSNVAEGIAVTVKREPGDGKRGYSDTEAAIVLMAGSKAKDPIRRWIPLLCAYSGARLGEACQLRFEDITDIRGIMTMTITSDAGPLKNRKSVRTIPLHPAVLDAGFLTFVKKVRSGPLFSELPIDRFGKRSTNETKIISRWVRRLGITDPCIQTSHGWRHRLRTAARVHKLAVDVVDAIVGHTRKGIGD
ncbi:tyrosine-type recombinase/integrase [uncultured Methylobacterium sp.]|uniref:site-specific integrase n=1 Tax=uncultured Methylobacterium sp. TaxID=157278 RepID=UPI0035C9C33F